MSARQTAKKAAAAPPKPDEQAPEQEPAAPDSDATEPEAPTADQTYVDALQREREGYVRYNRADRLKDVDAELKRLGAPLERAVTKPPETA